MANIQPAPSPFVVSTFHYSRISVGSRKSVSTRKPSVAFIVKGIENMACSPAFVAGLLKGNGGRLKIVFYHVSTGMIVLTNYTPEYEFCTSKLDISILCSLNMALCPQDTSFFLSQY